MVQIKEDGILGILAGKLHINSGSSDLVAVIGFENPDKIVNVPFSFSPFKNNVEKINFEEPLYAVNFEMEKFLEHSGLTSKDLAEAIVISKSKASRNPRASFKNKVTVEQVLNSEKILSPISIMDISPKQTGAACVLIASQELAEKINQVNNWVTGISWSHEENSSILKNDDISIPQYFVNIFNNAREQAKIEDLLNDIHLIEVEDSYSFQLLQYLTAMGFTDRNKPIEFIQNKIPNVNPSGGSIGMGDISYSNSLVKITEAVLQLNNMAMENQVEGKLTTALIQSATPLPKRSAGVVIIGREKI